MFRKIREEFELEQAQDADVGRKRKKRKVGATEGRRERTVQVEPTVLECEFAVRSVESEEGYGSVEGEEVEGGENGLVRWCEKEGGSHRREGGVDVGGELRKEEIEGRRERGLGSFFGLSRRRFRLVLG